MFIILSIILSIVYGFTIHTDLDIYAKKCRSDINIEETYSYVNDMIGNIEIYIALIYGDIFDDFLKDIIIFEKSDTFNGQFCPPSTIFIQRTDDFEPILDHELMHLINYHIYSFNHEWNQLNLFDYVRENYKYEPLTYGFICKYGMKSRGEDIATIYEEFMHLHYSNINGKYYDNIIMSKFKLLYKILITFDSRFKEIIEYVIEESNSKFPRLE